MERVSTQFMQAVEQAIQAGDIERMDELWARWKRLTPAKRQEILEVAPTELIPQIVEFNRRRPGSGGHNKGTGRGSAVIAVRVTPVIKMKADALVRKGVKLSELVSAAIANKFEKI